MGHRREMNPRESECWGDDQEKGEGEEGRKDWEEIREKEIDTKKASGCGAGSPDDFRDGEIGGEENYGGGDGTGVPRRSGTGEIFAGDGGNFSPGDGWEPGYDGRGLPGEDVAGSIERSAEAG